MLSRSQYKVGICSIAAVKGKYKVTPEDNVRLYSNAKDAYVEEYGEDENVDKLFEWLIRVQTGTKIQARYSVFDKLALYDEWGYKPNVKALEKITNEGIVELLLESSTNAIAGWKAKANVNNINQITHVITHTASTWQVPSLAHVIMQELNLPSSTKAIPLNGCGCAGAQSVFYLAQSIIKQEPEAVILCAIGEVFHSGTPTFFALKDDEKEYKNKESWISVNIMSDGAVSFIMQRIDINNEENISKRKNYYYLDKMGSFILPKSVWHYDKVSITKAIKHAVSLSLVGIELVEKMSLVFNKYFVTWYCDVMRIENSMTNKVKVLESLKNTTIAMHAGGKLIFRALEQVLTKLSLKDDEIKKILKYSIQRYKTSGNFGSASFCFALNDIINDEQHDNNIFCFAFGAGVSYQYSSLIKLKQVTNRTKQFVLFSIIAVLFAAVLSFVSFK